MVTVDDHEAGSGQARTVSRLGPFLAGDQPVLIETNVSTFADRVADTLRDLRRDGGRPDATVLRVERAPQSWLTSPWELRRDGEPVGTPVPDESVMVQLLAEIDRTVLLDGRARHVPVRAAAVADGERAVLIAGGHRTGKSTLASSLVRRDWGYVSDAVSLIDAGDEPVVQPYWRPFTGAGSTPIPASHVGSLAGPTRLAAIVIPRPPDRPGPPARVSPAAVIGPLTAHLAVVEDARARFHELVSLASTVPSWELTFMDDAAANAVVDILGGAP